MDEKSFVVNSFNENFKKYKNSNIVIYGLGKNTKAVLEECTDFCIVGLMDGTRTGEMQWGLKIFSENELINNNVKVVVIIATSSNVPLIYKRIRKFCSANNIMVFDINGDTLGNVNQEYEVPKLFLKINCDELYKKIDKADVVSFDIFDTLLVRDVLEPTDVFEIIGRENINLLPSGYDYKSNRVKAEHALYVTTNPKIGEIYDYMQDRLGFPSEKVEKFVETEIKKERELLHARIPMIEVVNYAKSTGKIICCTSDMYLTKTILSQILIDNGFDSIDEIIVSCEHGFSKCNGLFKVLRERYSNKKILHIGDNYDADIRSALDAGIDEAFEIVSGYKMLLKSSFSSIYDVTNSLSERKVLGEFVAHFLNNPFLFGKTNGKCLISDNYALGYYFLEPMIQTFLSWLIKMSEKDGIDMLLLGSRDGWLIKELLDLYSENNELSFEYIYFYASRSACTLAGMQNEEDVRYAASLAFDGNTEELLKKRFLLKPHEIYERLDDESDEDFFTRHIERILRNSRQYRHDYLKYINQYEIANKKLGFFDFVSSGTCQLWLEKIMNVQMTGYYFLKNYDEYKKHLVINSLLEPKFVYEKQSKLYKDYVFLENILTSPEATVKFIGNGGKIIFEEDKRSKETIEDLLEIHRGIKDAYRKRKNYKFISNEFAEGLVDIIRPEYSEIHVDFFNNNTLVDEFCNRQFELAQILSIGE